MYSLEFGFMHRQACGRSIILILASSFLLTAATASAVHYQSGRGRCVESLDKALLLPLSQGEAFTLASTSYLAILVKYKLEKKKNKKKKVAQSFAFRSKSSCNFLLAFPQMSAVHFVGCQPNSSL